jgi:hypothetical protein
MLYSSAKNPRVWCRLTPQFSGRALPYVPGTLCLPVRCNCLLGAMASLVDVGDDRVYVAREFLV